MEFVIYFVIVVSLLVALGMFWISFKLLRDTVKKSKLDKGDDTNLNQ